jgi:hypothetical protein
MSVAFRREGDEEHLEPKFEIPIPPGPNLMTALGLAQIGKRVAALEARLAEGDDEAGGGADRRADRRRDNDAIPGVGGFGSAAAAVLT